MLKGKTIIVTMPTGKKANYKITRSKPAFIYFGTVYRFHTVLGFMEKKINGTWEEWQEWQRVDFADHAIDAKYKN